MSEGQSAGGSPSNAANKEHIGSLEAPHGKCLQTPRLVGAWVVAAGESAVEKLSAVLKQPDSDYSYQ
jgi:hypothetical protein